MARIVYLTTEAFKEKFHGPNAFILGGEHRFASPNYRASHEESMRKDPSIEPIAWYIPSRMYNNDNWYAQVALNNLEVANREKPYYIITNIPEGEDENTEVNKSRNLQGLDIGGTLSYNEGQPEPQINYKLFPCSVHIEDCTFKVTLHLNYIKSDYSLVFKNCVFDKYLSLRGLLVKKIIFENCQFNNAYSSFIELNGETLNFINQCKFSILKFEFYKNTVDDLKIEKSSGESIEIFGPIHKNFSLVDSLCNQLKVDPNREYLPNNEVRLNVPVEFSLFRIQVDESLKKVFMVNKIVAETLSIMGFLNGGTLILKDIVTSNLIIENLVNEGKLRFHNIILKDDGIVKIIDSPLGKAEFNDVNLKKAKYLQIYLSNISEVVLHSINFPKKIIGKSENDFEGVRDFYRQIKNLWSKQGDVVRQLQYEQMEMSSYEKVLKVNNEKKDKIILLTNKWSNDHGQDWGLALYRLFEISFIFFCLIKLCLGHYHLDLSAFTKDIASFINFTVNPLHKLTELFGDKYDDSLSGFTVGLIQLLDILARLFSGYMIFQFLRAFRKYTKGGG